MLDHSLFNVPNRLTYPPFKNGLYLEEYFKKYFDEKKPEVKRTYIPLLWTNFQLDLSFLKHKQELQQQLDEFVKLNPNEHGYFTVIQHDEGGHLTLPPNTLVFNGGNNGDVPLPLIYEDENNTLVTSREKSTDVKRDILCSFVGRNTHTIRKTIYEAYRTNSSFKFLYIQGGAKVDSKTQSDFINVTLQSKFALAPRGYGRSSFRFFEIMQLGAVPIYVWDDKNWLPYQDKLNYDEFAIVIHESQITNLYEILSKKTDEEYKIMASNVDKYKSFFTLEYMAEYIVDRCAN